jgi:hypothetical protein
MSADPPSYIEQQLKVEIDKAIYRHRTLTQQAADANIKAEEVLDYRWKLEALLDKFRIHAAHESKP